MCRYSLLLSLIFIVTDLFAWQIPADSSFRRIPGHVSRAGKYRPAETRTTDLIHTSLKIGIRWKNQSVDGHAVLKFKPHFYPQDSVILDARAFKIYEIKLVDRMPATHEDFDKLKGKNLPFGYDRLKLRIALDRSYTRHDTLMIAIRYSAYPGEAEKMSVDDFPVERGMYFINPDGSDPYRPRQVWTQGETTGSSCWYPTLEAPNEKFTHDLFVTVENELLTLSNGKLINQVAHKDGTRTDHWRQSLPHAPYLTALVAGDFEKITDQGPGGLEVSYYVEPRYAPYARAIFGRTPEMIAYFSRLFDFPYPWEKYSQVVVRDFVAGAMENTTLTILKEETQKTDRELRDGDSDALIAHELVHHWFGNLVTCEEWGQLPLNESFANYAEYLWEEYRHGKDAADWSGYLEMEDYFAENQSKSVELIRYFYQHPDHMFDSHSYAKGGRILHMLRNYVGDEAFFASLSLYLKRHQFGTAELANLRMAFEEVTGEDLNWFFDQWFYRPGHPELAARHTYLPRENKLVLQVEQLQDTMKTTVYRLPLTIDIWEKGRKIRKTVILDRAKQEFTFSMKDQPDLVLLEGDGVLLGRVSHDKSKEEWLTQLRVSEAFPARFTALQQLASYLDDPEVRKQMAMALTDPFWKMRQEAVFQLVNNASITPEKSIEAQIAELATTDAHPLVRGEALLALDKLAPVKYREAIHQALEDSSYAVVATAISLVGKDSPGEMSSITERFKEVSAGPVLAALGDYKGDHPNPQDLAWFTRNFERQSSAGVYALLPSFGKYLVRSDRKVQQEGIRILSGLAKEHPGVSVRYGAYQILSWFDDRPGVREMMEEIRKKERNLQLVELLKAFHAE